MTFPKKENLGNKRKPMHRVYLPSVNLYRRTPHIVFVFCVLLHVVVALLNFIWYANVVRISVVPGMYYLVVI